MGLDGVYALVDRDNTLLLTRKDCVVAYRDADPTDTASPIIESARWPKPVEVEGDFVGVNLTFDGRLVLSTDHGWLVCLTATSPTTPRCSSPVHVRRRPTIGFA